MESIICPDKLCSFKTRSWQHFRRQHLRFSALPTRKVLFFWQNISAPIFLPETVLSSAFLRSLCCLLFNLFWLRLRRTRYFAVPNAPAPVSVPPPSPANPRLANRQSDLIQPNRAIFSKPPSTSGPPSSLRPGFSLDRQTLLA